MPPCVRRRAAFRAHIHGVTALRSTKVIWLSIYLANESLGTFLTTVSGWLFGL